MKDDLTICQHKNTDWFIDYISQLEFEVCLDCEKELRRRSTNDDDLISTLRLLAS